MTNENIYMLGICFAAMIFLFFMRPLRLIFKFVLRVFFFCGLIYLCNMFFAAVGIKSLFVGVNLLTAILSGFLGLPGIIFLYVSRFIV